MNVNLRKSDKMIAIVGVIILIVAGVGIALYTSAPETKTIAESEEMLYYPVFTAECGEMTISEHAGKTAYIDTVSITGVPSGGILTSVDFQITWQDDKIFGLIIKRGQDTLTADISYMGETETHTSTGSAKNETLSFSINSVPSVDYIEAGDEVEAGELLYQMVSGKSEATFDITVNVKTGEPLRRPLKFLGDKGNTFEIKIIYNYYRVDLEVEETDDDNDDDYTEEIYEGAVGEFYRNLCYGRSVI